MDENRESWVQEFIAVGSTYSVSQKNDTAVAHYNFKRTLANYGNFWQGWCWESMLSKGDVLSHLS